MLRNGQEFIGFMMCIGLFTGGASMILFKYLLTKYSKWKLSFDFFVYGIGAGLLQALAFRYAIYYIGESIYLVFSSSWTDELVADGGAVRTANAAAWVYGLAFVATSIMLFKQWRKEVAARKEKFEADIEAVSRDYEKFSLRSGYDRFNYESPGNGAFECDAD